MSAWGRQRKLEFGHHFFRSSRDDYNEVVEMFFWCALRKAGRFRLGRGCPALGWSPELPSCDPIEVRPPGSRYFVSHARMLVVGNGPGTWCSAYERFAPLQLQTRLAGRRLTTSLARIR